MALRKPMSDGPIDRERQLQRITYASIRGDTGSELSVIIAKDEESLNKAIALDLIASTAPARLGTHLASIREALIDGRWADALVEWMDATGNVVDVYPDEPVRESIYDDKTLEFELQMKPIFNQRGA